MAVYDYVTGTVDSARRQADRIVSPDDRQKAYDSIRAFAADRPLLFSFIAAQLLFSAAPVLLFTSFVLGTLTVSLVLAAASALFWTGTAAVLLGSTLLVTSGLAALAWAWVVGTYIVGSFVYGLVFAGVPQPAAGDGGRDARVKIEEKLAGIRGEAPAGDGRDGADGISRVGHREVRV